MNLANTYKDLGDTLKAEETYLKAAQLAIKTNLKNVELYVYTNLSSLYTELKKWDKTYDKFSLPPRIQRLGREFC